MSDGHDGYFDDATILAMCLAFDRTCKSHQPRGVAANIQESVAIRIIQAAMQGERDPDRLYAKALKAFGEIRESIAA